VNKAVMQMDEGTQQNAALVEQTSAASQSMADQARGLKASMQKYVVNGVATPAEAGDDATESPEPSVERRKANRPWGGKRTAAPAAKVAPVRRVAGDDDAPAWKEF